MIVCVCVRVRARARARALRTGVRGWGTPCCVPDKIFTPVSIKMNSFEVPAFYIVVNLTLIEDHRLGWCFWDHGAGENVWT